MPLTPLSPAAARDLLARGAWLVDVRDGDEHAREHIAGARLLPLARLSPGALQGAPAVIFHCASGMRTAGHARQLGACAQCEAYVLEGGLDGWKRAGLPVVTDARQPLPLQRQVQIAAGALVVLGAVLGAAVSPWFHGLSAFVGGGLVFAGASGFCGLARVLARMPWNRRLRAAA